MAQEIRTAIGELAYLRVHEVGSGFGPESTSSTSKLSVASKEMTEGRLHTREDGNRFAHAGMLDLLRDAFNQDTIIEIEYLVNPGELSKGTARSSADPPEIPLRTLRVTIALLKRPGLNRGAFGLTKAYQR